MGVRNVVVRVLRRMFGPKGDETTEGRRKLYNEELFVFF
jgi:hypothetical protein